MSRPEPGHGQQARGPLAAPSLPRGSPLAARSPLRLRGSLGPRSPPPSLARCRGAPQVRGQAPPGPARPGSARRARLGSSTARARGSRPGSALMRNKLRHIPSVISSSAAKIYGKIMARAPATRRHRLSARRHRGPGPAAGPVAGRPPAGGAARRLRAARGRPLPCPARPGPARPRSFPRRVGRAAVLPRGGRRAGPGGVPLPLRPAGGGRRLPAPLVPAAPGAPEGRRIGPAGPGSCPSPPAPRRSWRWSAALFLLLLALK